MKKSELKEIIKAEFLAEAKDSKKGNEDEQKRMEGAIRDNRDHIKKLKADIEADEKKLAKLKKDYKRDVVKEDLEEMRGSSTYEEDDIQAEAADAGLLKKIGIDGDVMEMVKKMRAAIESGKVKDEDLGGIEGIGDAVKQMVVDSAESFLKEAEEVDVEDNVDVDVDVEDDIDIDDVSDKSEIEVDSELSGESSDVSAILGLLTKAQEKAGKMGDEKLLDQIGNTITYYTRAHVVAEDAGEDELEEMRVGKEMDIKDMSQRQKDKADPMKEELNEEFARFQKLAGLIK